MLKRIAIMGTGSLGTILGAFLSKAGLDITLIDAWEEHVNALNEKGATVTGGVEMTVPVKACTPENMEGTYDLFIYLAKQTYNETAIPQMVAHSHENTIICTGQNGLPELAVAEQFPKERIAGCPVGWPATFLSPGVSRLTCPEGSPLLEFHLGTLEGPVTPWLLEIKAILENMCPVHLTENLMADRWSKVMINSTLSGMSTVVNGSFGDAVNGDKSCTCLIRVGQECVKVCQAQNIDLPEIFGVDFQSLYADTTLEGEEKARQLLRARWHDNQGEASMLQDLKKGKRCEIAMINGVVSNMARKLGIETPYCDAVVRIVSEIEAGKRPLAASNVEDMPAV